MKQLSERLRVIADQVIPGLVVVDVGTDHAYLPIFLVQQEICPRVIGVEVNPGPLRSAEQQVQAAGLTSWIDIRAGNGLQAIQVGEAQIAVVAGMGGKTICEILQASPAVTASLNRLILQPMGAIRRVRAWLRQNAWNIVQEELLLEDAVFYLVIVAEPQPPKDSALLAASDCETQDLALPTANNRETEELEVGEFLLERRHPLLPRYLKQQMEREQRVLNQLNQSKDSNLNEKREKLQKRIELFGEMINQLKE